MYTGWTRLLIVFLTHPGVIVSVPASGMLMLWGRGLLQASVVLAMHSASETKMSQLVQYLYWAALLMWTWIKVEVADKSIV
jgi:hypothetical protein